MDLTDEKNKVGITRHSFHRKDRWSQDHEKWVAGIAPFRR